MEIKRVIGLEIANSSIKLVYGSEDNKEIYYLNTVEEIEESKLNDIMNINLDNVFEYKGKKYRVGDEKATGSGGISDLRYESESFLRECIFALSQIVKSKDEKIYMVTGLPSSEYDDDDKIKRLKKNLLGKYIVKHKEIERTFEIVEITVIPQPLGTLLNYLFTKDLKERVSSDEMENSDYLVFDIGFGTSDFCVANFERGISQNKTIYNAMSTVTSWIMEEINKQYPSFCIYRYCKPYEVNLQLQKGTKLTQRGKGTTIDIKDIIEEVHNRFVDFLYNELLKLDYRFSEYRKIIFTGGGSIAMKKALEKKFNKEVECAFIDNPVMANARGFYILAKQNY